MEVRWLAAKTHEHLLKTEQEVGLEVGVHLW